MTLSISSSRWSIDLTKFIGGNGASSTKNWFSLATPRWFSNLFILKAFD